jgi:hypothetical protein
MADPQEPGAGERIDQDAEGHGAEQPLGRTQRGSPVESFDRPSRVQPWDQEEHDGQDLTGGLAELEGRGQGLRDHRAAT